MTPPPLEPRDYIGLGTAGSSSSSSANGEAHLALRLGLPGSENGVDAALTLGCPAAALLLPRGGGAKRGFLHSQLDRSAIRGADADAAGGHDNGSGDAAAGAPRAAKAQVVGWPPVRSYRKNTLAATANAAKPKVGDEGRTRSETGCCYVKVSMDGAPYLRKVDLGTYSSYDDLSLGLEKMFSCFITGKSSPHESSRGDRLGDGSRADALRDQEYVLTYEDEDADWMLVGDLPWDPKVTGAADGSEQIGALLAYL